MRRIVINGERFYENRFYGTVRYTYEMLLALDRIAEPGSIALFAPKCGLDQGQFRSIKLIKCGSLSSNNKAASAFARVTWKYLLFPLYAFSSRSLTVNFTPVWGFYNFDVITVHDCTPEAFYAQRHYGETINIWWKRLVRNERKMGQKCRLVLTVSNSAKSDIIKYYHVPERKVKVIPNAWQHFQRVEEDPSILAKYGLEKGSFFFSLGSRLPHKNILWVTSAARKYPRHTFVVTGDNHVVKDTSFEGDIPENMIFTGYLSDGEIKCLMGSCKAFIQPSLYEGFGIPPLEAMSVGADCIVSDIPVFREIYENAVWYMDPNDYENIDLDRIMAQSKDDNAVILEKYSWEKSAAELWDILKELARE